MIKSQLIDWIADEMNISRQQAKGVVNTVLEGIARALVTDGQLSVRGFGNFEVRQRGGRTVRLPHHQDEVSTPDRAGVLFRPSEALRSRLEAKGNRT